MPVAQQIKRNERKVKKLLKGNQETYMDKVFREMEEETRRHGQIEARRARQRDRYMDQKRSEEQELEQEEHLVTRAERQAQREAKQKEREDKLRQKNAMNKLKGCRTKKGQPVQEKLVEYLIQKIKKNDEHHEWLARQKQQQQQQQE